MKPLSDIVTDRKMRSRAQADQDRLADRIGQNNDRSSSMATGTIVAALERMADDWSTLSESQQSRYREALSDLSKAMNEDGLRVNNLGEIPKAETTVSVNLQGIEKIEAKSIAVEGLTELMQEIGTALRGLDAAMKRPIPKPEVTVNVPPIQIPEIRLPEIKVPQLRIPEIKIPTITVPKAEVMVTENKGKRTVEMLTQYDSFGNVVSITDIYEDGSSAIATGINTNKIKVEYR